MEWITRDSFVKFKPKLEKKEREFLTKAELLEIERLMMVKDLFVLVVIRVCLI
jgi:hypothetical protein